MTTSKSSDGAGPGLVETMLGVPPGYPSWRIAHMAGQGRVLATWLSSLVARGLPISPPAGQYLARMRRRVSVLHEVGELMSSAHGVRVIKGARIAGRMPAGLLRLSGDADLVAPDEPSLWACVLDLRDRYGAEPQGVNVLETASAMDVVVAMKWPAEEPHLDKPMGADISTCTFSGDMAGVPVRVTGPADDDLCSLFAVAEERFQRRFTVKDLIDLVVLADALHHRLGDEVVDVVVSNARTLCLAPELRQLIKKASTWVPLPGAWPEVAHRLQPLAAEEKALRRASRPGVARLRFGFPLDTVSGPQPRIVLHRGRHGDIARTPIGNCLLVETPTIDQALCEWAQSEASRISAV